MADEAGGGRCEVVCFTSDTHGSFATLSPTRARTVLEAWIDRTEEIGATEGVEQVFVFENRGAEIGVTLPHPHGQIYGYPYVTPKTQTMLRRAREHREATGRNLFRDVLDAERRAGDRVVFETEHFTAYVPPPRAGPSRSTSRPTATSPTCPPSPTPSARTSSAPTSTCWAGSTATTPTSTRCPTSRAGSRPPSARAATSSACTCRCSPSCGARGR